MNSDPCPICLDSAGKFIQTPCGHSFHKKCILKITRPVCPMCKTDLISFLIANGINRRKLMQRIQEDETRNFIDNLDQYSLSGMDMSTLYELAAITRFQNPDWFEVYCCIVFTQIKNAKYLFCEVSHLKHTQGQPGVFLGEIEPDSFCLNVLDNYRLSNVKYAPLSEFVNEDTKNPEDLEFYNLLVEYHNEITDTTKEFVCVLMTMENDCPCRSIFHIHEKIEETDKEPIEHVQFRICNEDLIESTVRCKLQFTAFNSNATNGEYTYMKKVLKNLKKSIKTEEKETEGNKQTT